jgi:hypothetical protein
MMALMTQTRDDRLAKRAEYRRLHREELNAKARQYHADHKVERNAKSIAYVRGHAGDVAAYKKAYREAHRDEINAKKRQWHAENKTAQNEKSLAYFYEHHDELLVKNHEYKVEHRSEMNEYGNAWRDHHREVGGKILAFRAWLHEQKSAPCADCHHKFAPCAMDFDHVRGEKSFNIGSTRGSFDSERSRERVLEEIAKCDLVCANCHRVRTRDRNQAARLERTALAVRGDES